MGELIAEAELRDMVCLEDEGSSEHIIFRGSHDCLEGIKYDFRFGGRFLKAVHGEREVTVDQFPPGETSSFAVQPGETVFVLSQERLQLPRDIKAELSHKRKLAHEGVLVMGGFCVDPLYRGVLIFGIHNISSEPFILEPGKKLIAAQFYRLDESEIDPDARAPEPMNSFPRDIVRSIQRFAGASTRAIDRKLIELEAAVAAMREDLRQREEWFDDMKDIVTGLQTSIHDLTGTIQAEREQRLAGEDRLSKAVVSVGERAHSLDTRMKIIYAVSAVIFVVVSGVIIFLMVEGIKSLGSEDSDARAATPQSTTATPANSP
ncbi:MAG: hypothetical protein DWQ36_16635 [Acidobacteria bacterium]|nr:MAG: hypothetical protein DWQ36_16635 [Acidobacteriota bacterium]